MDPKPIFRRGANLSRNYFVSFGGERLHGIARLIKPIGKDKAPARLSFGMDGRGDERGAGAFGQKRRERRGGCKPPEKRRPQTVIAGMLIAQNADQPAAAQQLDGAMESFAAIEQFHSGATAHAPDVRVDVAIAELLINGAVADVTDVVGKKLREQFPIAQMTKNKNDRRSLA